MSIKNKLNKILRRFNVELHGLGYLQALAKGDFKKSEFDYFSTAFKTSAITIFDVGANRGHTTQTFLQLFPNASIFAFEPLPQLVEEFKKNMANREGVKIFASGISATSGNLQFHVNKSVDTSSFLPSQQTGLNSDPQVANVEQITVPVTTIDAVCSQENIEHIHLLKLDIQGSELNALKGAVRMLAAGKIDVVYTEAYCIQQYVDQPLLPEIALFLSQYGFQMQDIYNPIYGNGKLAWCDVVFVRNNF